MSNKMFQNENNLDLYEDFMKTTYSDLFKYSNGDGELAL